LVELVAVIAVLGILAAGSVRFLHFAAEGYSLAGGRASCPTPPVLQWRAWQSNWKPRCPTARASAQLHRVHAGQRGDPIPDAAARDRREFMQIAVPDASMLPASSVLAAARVVVDPSGSKVYDTASGYVSSVAAFSAPDATGVVTATFPAR